MEYQRPGEDFLAENRCFAEFRGCRSLSYLHGMATIQRVTRRDLVHRVASFLEDNLAEPVTVAELSRMVGVSERTLRAAFHDVVGRSPKQYVIHQRLCAAHEALSAADPQSTTVTDVATAYGFFELGRFAGRYRDAFGEVPSHTLRQNVSNTAAAQAA